MFRRPSLLLSCSLAVASTAVFIGDGFARDAPASAMPPFAFEEATIAQLQARMASGVLDSQRLTRLYLDRIAALDDSGPMLNAVIELNPDALREAAALDAERKAGSTASQYC